jgi:hypothetical protein
MQNQNRLLKINHSLNRKQWLDFYVDGWLLASLWGTAKVKYESWASQYMVMVNALDSFIWVDAIKVRKDGDQ